MLQLIKTEITYKKWDYLTLMVLPFLISGFLWAIFLENNKESMDLTDATLFGFGAALLVICLRLPQAIHQTSVEENRFHLFATLPVSLREIAMSQSAPIVTLIGIVSVIGFLFLGILELGYNSLPLLAMFNCVLLASGIGLVGIFLKELLTMLPKYSSLVLWVMCFALIILNSYLQTLVDAEVTLLDIRYILTWQTSVALIFLNLIAFWGHMILFTKVRDDFSVRRRHS